MFKLKDMIIGIIISALLPLALLIFIKYNSTSTVEDADGSVTQTAIWISFTLSSYLFTVVCIFIFFMIIYTIIRVLRKK
ncbi:hypothetical protein SAMN05518855_100839 [Paenibacillus sp. CF384]|nr:hypothetical protein SAMN05518855_100839 [Paenibacillus sp. CF384]